MLQPLLIATAFCVAHTIASSISHQATGLVPDDIWKTSFANPNATGSLLIKGYNLSSPFPSIESDSWKFTIKVRDGLPQSPEAPGKLVTGIWLELDAPDNLVRKDGNRSFVPEDPSWQVCQGFWDVSTLRSSTAQTVDASCEGVLPKECVAAMTRQLRTGFGARSGGRSFQCPDLIASDPACKDFIKGDYSAVGTVLPAGNTTNLTDAGIFDYGRLGLDGDVGGHALGNTTAYDEAVHRVYLVGITWGYSNVSGVSRTDTPSVNASFGCLSVNQVAPGSRALSAGTSVLRAGSLPLTGLAMGAALMLLVS